MLVTAAVVYCKENTTVLRMLSITCACDLQGGLIQFVCAWGGEDVEKQATYGSFSLMLIHHCTLQRCFSLPPRWLASWTLSRFVSATKWGLKSLLCRGRPVRIPAFDVAMH
jgi:hypothetical protein